MSFRFILIISIPLKKCGSIVTEDDRNYQIIEQQKEIDELSNDNKHLRAQLRARNGGLCALSVLVAGLLFVIGFSIWKSRKPNRQNISYNIQENMIRGTLNANAEVQ